VVSFISVRECLRGGYFVNGRRRRMELIVAVISVVVISVVEIALYWECMLTSK